MYRLNIYIKHNIIRVCVYFSGDIDDDEEVLDWLTDPSNMELTEHIEKVNRKMFAKIRQSSENVAVFFCKIIIVYFSIRIARHGRK